MLQNVLCVRFFGKPFVRFPLSSATLCIMPHKTSFSIQSLIAMFFCWASILISKRWLTKKGECARWISATSLLFNFFCLSCTNSWRVLICVCETSPYVRRWGNPLLITAFYISLCGGFALMFSFSSFIFRSFPTPYVLRHNDKTRIHSSFYELLKQSC